MIRRMGPKLRLNYTPEGMARLRELLRQSPDHIVVNSATLHRGPFQQISLEVLGERGVELNEEQKRQAGLTTAKTEPTS